jgi:uncharacterized protein
VPLTFSPVIVIALLLAVSGVSHASSFDCTSAASPSEKAICADAYTSNLDKKLGELWSATLPKVADPKALKTDQLQWLKQRNLCADDLSCLRQKYQMRITELGYMATPFSWDATWQMIPWGVANDGELKTRRKDSTHITFNVLAANGANMGNLDGVATLEGTTAHYAEGDCALTFIAMNGVLDVNQQGSDSECGAGMGVFYAGRYVASEQSLPLEDDLLSVGLVRTQQEDDAMRTLLKDDYRRLVESSSSRTKGDASSDVPGAEVDEMWVRGLGGINASIFMRATDSRFWLVLIVSDSKGNLRARYYTNVPGWKGRLPETLQRWYDKRAAAGSLPLDQMP